MVNIIMMEITLYHSCVTCIVRQDMYLNRVGECRKGSRME